MKITILSLFPEFFKSMLETSMLKRAIEKGVIELELVNIRDFGVGKHKVVDDKPFGGGPGMLMKPEPVIKAIDSVRTDDSHVIFFSPGGELLHAKKCEGLAKTHKHLILLCGHYEGIDQRIVDLAVDEEISIGDYVLTSGMIPALVLLDGTLRFLEGGVGNSDSAYGDTFHLDKGLKGPQYTRPAVFKEVEVPKVLQSGNHKEIALWRKKAGAERTLKREHIKTRMA
jgi:tRNA (guanine37-N1)-methyltransferase